MPQEASDMNFFSPQVIWVLIPIAAIFAKTLKSWLQLKAQQQSLGASNHELEREVATLRKDREALLERLENIEAIVVSQTWNALHDNSLPPVEKEHRVAAAVRRELAPAASIPSNQQRAEQLARRLQG
jgi:hypothetical protein